MSWNAEKIIQMAGIRLEDADKWLIAVAEKCAERCYYLDRAAEEFVRIVSGTRY